jgi:predicted RNA binding protein YcfA (HicA-like mRNA interferase family)
MPKKIGELKAMLRKAGFACRRVRGSHERWIHEALPDFLLQLQGRIAKMLSPT